MRKPFTKSKNVFFKTVLMASEMLRAGMRVAFATSASVGAANNTLLYIDNVRLLKKDTNVEDALETPQQDVPVDVYSLQGVCLRTAQPAGMSLQGLDKGIYLVGGKKVVVE